MPAEAHARVAIVAGVDRYPDFIPNLNYCVVDAEAIGDVLGMPEYGFEVIPLFDADVTRANLMRVLLEAQARQPEALLLYFAGHGVTTSAGTYLVTSDAAPYDEGLELSKIVSILTSGAGADTAIAVFDCCNAGAASLPATPLNAVHGIQTNEIDAAFRAADGNRAVLGACLANQSADEAASLGHGAFTYYLLEGLLGAAADHEGRVTLASLHEYVARPFEQRTGQTPVLYGALAGTFPIGVGLDPCLAPPIERTEAERLAAQAVELEQEHHRRRLRSTPQDWAAGGFAEAAQDLERIIVWFEDNNARYPQLLARDSYREAWARVQHHRASLGTISSDTRLPRGRAVRKLGQGSFGAVWKVDLADGTSRAYKSYHPNDLGDSDKTSRFRRGYDAMKALDHPRIVKVDEYTEAPLGFYMDYIDGVNLRDLNPYNSVDAVDALFILIATAEAVHHAHSREVVHRDIKPENIVCRFDQESQRWIPMLTDFDLAWINTGTQVTREGIGNLLYAAPEQFLNFTAKAVSGFYPGLDVFSLGQLAYFVLTGSDPSPTRLEENCENLRDRIAGWTSSDAAALMAALYDNATQFSVRDRTESVAEMLDDLREVQRMLTPGSGRENLDAAAFLRELEFSFTGRPPLNDLDADTRSFRSTSGQSELLTSLKLDNARSSATLTTHVIPGERVGFEGLSNQTLRKRLNQRVDAVLSHYDGARRRAGTVGTFTVFVDLFELPLTPEGLSKARRVLTDVLAKVEGS